MAANLDRRGFLAAAGGLVVAIALPAPRAVGAATPAAGAAAAAAAAAGVTPYLAIAPDGAITLSSPTTEMGQGTHTAHALIVADELGVDPARIRVVVPQPADPFRRGPAGGNRSMSSGGSWGVRAWFLPLRTAAAQAREMLVAAAATRLGVDAASLELRDGVVHHAASGRSLAFGALAAEAAALPVPATPRLKAAGELKYVGRGIPRLDSREKSTGAAQYSSDVRVPGMLYACGRMAPVFKAQPLRVDAARAKAVPGVVEVATVPGGVAVIATTSWAAIRGADLVDVEWNSPPVAGTSSATISAAMRAGLDAEAGEARVARDAPGLEAAMARAARTVVADYEVPFLAHAPFECWSCTVRPNADGTLEVWAPTQAQDRALNAIAASAKLEPARVRLHTTTLGGGFGRRIADDGFAPAVAAALAVNRPVKFFWRREDEFERGWFRPAQAARLRAGLDADGRLLALHVRVAGPSLWTEFTGQPLAAGRPDASSVQNFADVRYRCEAYKVEHVLRHVEVTLAPWRAVGATHNAFFLESFLDEVAVASAQDPVALRRALLAHDARATKVIDAVAEACGWGGPVPAGAARGFAYFECYGSLCAQVVEARLVDGEPRATRVWVALDCGDVILPDQARAQVEGGVIQGLSSAAYEAVTITNGRADQANFDRYRLMRIAEAPPVIDVRFVRSGETLGGVGEPPLPPVIPAYANAVSRLTGKRVRTLPVVAG